MSWPLATLESLASDEARAITDGPFGSNLARQHYTSSGPRVIRLQNIGDREFIDNPAHISQAHFERLRAHEVLPGDLLVASLGEVLPRGCLAPNNLGPAIVKADCIRVRLAGASIRSGCSIRCSALLFVAGPTSSGMASVGLGWVWA